MEPVERTTFIHPDGTEELTVTGGVAFDTNDMQGVRLNTEKVPSWAGVGANVVAARDDGSVIVAFAVDVVDTEPDLWEDEGVGCTVFRCVAP